MEQPLFSCPKCYRNFPQSEMSRSGQTCKNCNPHHSTFKQCEYCKSDFKYYVYGVICPRCQSLKSKYGEPQPCSICRLKTAFGNALVCQRCLHYRDRFGEPRECQTCGQTCAFLKDEASRRKVDGQILCWVCTYNFKLARSRERSDHGSSKRRNEASDSARFKTQREIESQLKRARSDDYGSLKSNSNLTTGSQPAPSTQNQNLDSVYNEQLLTISQLQDELKSFKRQLAIKDAELLAKDRAIAEIRSEMIEMKGLHEDRILKAKAAAHVEQERLTSVIKQLQKEKAALSQGVRKRKSGTNLVGMSGMLRHSVSSVALFNPDSPIQVASSDRMGRKSEKPEITKRSEKPTSLIADRDTSTSTPNGSGGNHKSMDLSTKTEIAEAQETRLTICEPNSPTHSSNFDKVKEANSSPSISSDQPSDEDGERTPTGRETHFVNASSTDPLGLDTPSESEEDTS
ncbi:hypothetical protein EG68_06741 [Paragonimus skrjabini miyazakii]|uniref:Protein FAM76A n=1 Tax=Paragonimus skrjabini miyazakii TaxID=59628 RepID=A0A8S9YN15_9TREM|nr:hypothetical protein EG68_06741 [Paragonimus skrjabini miyazakii]